MATKHALWTGRGSQRGFRGTAAMLVAGFAAALGGPPPAHACRCAPRVLEHYWGDAEIVLIGTVRTIRAVATPEGTRHLEVDVEPQLTAGQAIKGDLEGVVLATADNSASCGVDVVIGETYLLFASRQTPGDRLAWFDTCNGSRLYPGGSRAAEMEPFVGLPISQIVPRLFELAGAPPVESPAPRFHTHPACWSEPRLHQTGAVGAELSERVLISSRRSPAPSSEGAVSPNGAYRWWTRNPSIHDATPRSAVIIVDVERDERLWIELRDVAAPVSPTWVNEKLLFVRAWWGRSVGIDLLIDVEAGTLVYQEGIDAGTTAFERYRDACAGQCPCPATNASSAAQGAPRTTTTGSP